MGALGDAITRNGRAQPRAARVESGPPAPVPVSDPHAELAEVERLLRMERDGVAGSCSHCGAPHSRGALFCWQCGATLMERLPSGAPDGQAQNTEIMDALLNGHAQEPASRAQE